MAFTEKQLAQAEERRRALRVFREARHAGMSNRSAALKAGYSFNTLYGWSCKCNHRHDMPIGYYVAGYKIPKPPLLPHELEVKIANEEYQVSGQNVVDARKHLLSAAVAYRWVKKNHEEARLRLIAITEKLL